EPDECLNVGEQRQLAYIRKILGECFPLSGVPDYEPPAERSLASLAEERAVELEEVAYDELLGDDALLFYPLYNYAERDHRALYDQLLDPDAVVGLNDGGAHCAYICDASIPTYMLTHWARDRSRGPRLALAESVRRLTSQPAELYGLSDRGRIASGLRADLNVIDLDRLCLSAPRAVSDLPAGGTRLLQSAVGYDATIVAGTVTRRLGVDTGARPGRLLRNHS
ncbi:MAG: amidohydrolase family protein, partial [Acidimicrobiia bacterium]